MGAARSISKVLQCACLTQTDAARNCYFDSSVMDPLSIIAGVIAVSGVTASSLQRIREFYTAETEVLCLVNEVSDLRLILDEIHHTLRERGQNISLQGDRAVAIASVLNRAQADFEEINQTLNDGVFRLDPDMAKRKIGRFSWMRQKSTLKRLQLRLKDTRLNLTTLCSNAALSDLSHIQLQLSGITVAYSDCKSQLVEQNRLLETLFQQRDNLDPQSLPIEEDLRSASSADKVPATWIQTSSGSNSNSTSDVQTTRHLNLIQRQDLAQKYSSIQIRATRHKKIRCEAWCSCRCHQAWALQTPNVMKQFLGSLFVGYNGIPSLSSKCNEKYCQGQSAPTLRLSYYFPSWFLNRTLQFAILGSCVGGPQISLSLPKVVADNSDVFVFAVQGNLDGMRSLFKRGAASPFDVGVGTGRTALHYAINYDHLELAQFLIYAGADPHTEDLEQATTVALAWNRIFGSLSEPSIANAFRYMFEDEDFLESRVFQPVHKIVLGLSDVSLEQHLRLSTNNIDAVDTDGRTALSWAANRGDIEAVGILLRFGADPNIPSLWGQVPLHWAAKNKGQNSCRILEKLLEHGAEINAIDYWNRTALTYASGNHPDLLPIQLLVEKGTFVNVRDRRLRTALGYAARLGSFRHVRYLIMSGADPNLPDEFNVLPLLEAVKNNYHDILRLLIPISHPLQIRPYSSSLIHWVAAFGDTTTVEVLQGHPLDNLFESSDLVLTNAEDLTPQDIFDHIPRTVYEKEILHALIQRISEIDKQ